jgi:hypothetical protein
MNPHFHSEMSQSRLAEIEKSAEWYRREGTPQPRPRFGIRLNAQGQIVFRLRPAAQHG